MGSPNTSSGGGSSKPATPTTNDYSAEKSASTISASAPPAPLLNLNMTDPAALELVRKRVLDAKTAKGRSSLRIPLSPAASGTGGIAIPT